VSRPSFFCVGAQKAGTTALHHYLAQHPSVFLPRIKETHFFNDGHGEWKEGFDYYLHKYFTGSGDRIAGEIDPEYLFFPESAGRIAEHVPSAKLIFLFRNPVSRAYSHYWMMVRRGKEKLDFASAVLEEPRRMALSRRAMSDYSYVSRGYYFRQVSHYLNRFHKEGMLFLLSEDLWLRPEETLSRVFSFLGIESIPVRSLESSQINKAAMPFNMGVQDFLARPSKLKSAAKTVVPARVRRRIRDIVEAKNRREVELPQMPESVERELAARYHKDTMALGELIGRELLKWRRATESRNG
jgi:hypothetical protein